MKISIFLLTLIIMVAGAMFTGLMSWWACARGFCGLSISYLAMSTLLSFGAAKMLFSKRSHR